jgi:dTDP-4-amino-4,6-dideoxygalactose transaminase
MSDKIEYFNVNKAPLTLKLKWKLAIQKVLKSGQFIGGDFLIEFEDNWKNYLGSQYASGVGNGYDGLVIALKALGISNGDRVAVPAHTFIATWLAVDAVGAIPVGVDTDKSGLISLEKLAKLKDIDAVIPVHMHGNMVDMRHLIKWTKTRGIKVIEDCAQAHGAELCGKKAGTWGDIGVFSMYPSKNLGAFGDGGIIVTNNKVLARKINSIKNYGSKNGQKYEYELIGVNSRLDPLQASILNVSMRYLDNWNHRRNEIAKIYIERILNLAQQVQLINDGSVYHHFTIYSRNRDKVREFIHSQGIQTLIHYPQTASSIYCKLKNIEQTTFSNAEEITKQTFSIPLHQWLQQSEIEKIVSVLNKKEVQENLIY